MRRAPKKNRRYFINAEGLLKYLSTLDVVDHDYQKRYREDPINFLCDMEYKEIRMINNHYYGLMRMMYTVALYCKLNDTGNSGGRLCFDTWANASLWLKNWDGIETPTEQDGLTSDKRV